VVFWRTPDGPRFALIKEKGRWGFPKGNIEKDETPELTALEKAQWFTLAGARHAIGFKNSRETLDAAIAGVEAGQVAS